MGGNSYKGSYQGMSSSENRRPFRGGYLHAAIERLPHGLGRAQELLSAIQKADQAGDHYWRLFFRYEYAGEVTFHDDPTKAMPVAAEFSTIFEEHPDALLSDGAGPQNAAEMYLMIVQMGIDPLVDLPQVSIEQWEGLMQQFRALVQRYHIGLRTYWWQMTQFYACIDIQQAMVYFDKFWKTGRDGLSDCRACERSNAARICLMAGDRAAADEYSKPLWQNRMHFCNDTPHKMWLFYLEDALRRHDWTEAEPLASKIIRKVTKDKGHLWFFGPLIQCWAKTDPERAVQYVEQCLPWSIDMWNQREVYQLYKGAWATFRELKQQSVSLKLPTAFPLYQPDGVYGTAALADWFYQHAADIAAQFDQRNGSRWFTKDLKTADW